MSRYVVRKDRHNFPKDVFESEVLSRVFTTLFSLLSVNEFGFATRILMIQNHFNQQFLIRVP